MSDRTPNHNPHISAYTAALTMAAGLLALNIGGASNNVPLRPKADHFSDDPRDHMPIIKPVPRETNSYKKAAQPEAPLSERQEAILRLKDQRPVLSRCLGFGVKLKPNEEANIARHPFPSEPGIIDTLNKGFHARPYGDRKIIVQNNGSRTRFAAKLLIYKAPGEKPTKTIKLNSKRDGWQFPNGPIFINPSIINTDTPAGSLSVNGYACSNKKEDLISENRQQRLLRHAKKRYRVRLKELQNG